MDTQAHRRDALRWRHAARVLALMSVLLLVWVEVSPGSALSGLPESAADWFELLTVPYSAVFGLALAWWRPRAGGAIALSGVLLHTAWYVTLFSAWPAWPLMLPLLPALLFLVYASITHDAVMPRNGHHVPRY